MAAAYLQRCLTLARALSARGWRASIAMREESFATAATAELAGIGKIALSGRSTDESSEIAAALGGEGADVVIVDHYERDRRFEAACRHFARRIAVIGDLADRSHDADLLVDQTFGRAANSYAPLVPPGCRLLCGSRYALLREAFLEDRPTVLARRRVSGPVRRILVAMGAMDAGNSTAMVLDALALVTQRLTKPFLTDVVLGASAPHLADIRDRHDARLSVRLHVDVGGEAMAALMATADLGVGAGGISSWERCCLGLPAVVVVTAPNQATITANVEAAGACRRIEGVASAQNAASIANAVAELCADRATRRAMSDAAAVICDGQGTARVVGAIEEMVSGRLCVHKMSFA